MVGLGRMGGNMLARLRWNGHRAADLDMSEEAVNSPTITLALYERFSSRMEDTFADKMLAMMRNQFGGHAVRTTRP
jgi:6-phosphogluconate dehydrogenase